MPCLRLVVCVLAMAGAAPAIALAQGPPAALEPLHAQRGTTSVPGRIVDALGREVLLRGVNVNGLGEYFQGGPLPPTFELTARDADEIDAFGWNMVRLVVSWSRLEPRPGEYDDAYVARIRDAVAEFAGRGIYTIVDMHQDAWGIALAARPAEACPKGSQPAIGWDGAPGWATIVPDGALRCAYSATRETSPAVRAAWDSFFADAPGPGGVGLQQRFAAAWSHLASAFARDPAVAAFDLLNEPGVFGAANAAGLARLYARTLRAIRGAERVDGGIRHIALIEPGVLWSAFLRGPPRAFAHDSDVAYGPHLYTGVFDKPGPPRASAFRTARQEAAQLGGLPLLTGEWGAAPARAAAPERYFRRHQQLQDHARIGAALWLWKASCGDPHQVWNLLRGPDAGIWGPFSTDCATNVASPAGAPIDDELRWGYPRAAPGRLTSTSYDQDRRELRVRGVAGRADAGAALVAYYPGTIASRRSIVLRGLDRPQWVQTATGALLSARSLGRPWSLRIKP